MGTAWGSVYREIPNNRKLCTVQIFKIVRTVLQNAGSEENLSGNAAKK